MWKNCWVFAFIGTVKVIGPLPELVWIGTQLAGNSWRPSRIGRPTRCVHSTLAGGCDRVGGSPQVAKHVRALRRYGVHGAGHQGFPWAGVQSNAPTMNSLVVPVIDETPRVLKTLGVWP